MLFTSLEFLFLFLPLVLAVHCLLPMRFGLRNLWLLAASLLFYAWGEPTFVLVMLASIGLNYVLALVVDAFRGRRVGACAFALAVLGNLALLGLYKYANFFTSVARALLPSWQGVIPQTSFVLPIGISFFTFQALSYLIDVKRGAPAQRNPFSLALYIALFPQLVAGPIVRYATIAADIENRRADFENIVAGIRRFAIGLAKKVLIADTMASIVDVIFAAKVETIPTAYCWLGAVAYTLQIYFDFSGYSDMAIGLGRVFNFRFLENFDHPYCARSVQEFWRRWHISLSTWFRDYLYIPLGGNRKGALRTYCNMFTVFLLCGLWHGAAWNFVVWGVYHGVGLVVERAGFGKLVTKLPKPLANAYLLLFVIVGWVFFRAPDLGYAAAYLGNMFGGSPAAFRSFAPALNFIVLDKFILLAVGCVAAYPVFDAIVRRIPEAVRLVCGMTFFAVVFILAITSAYSPFIYFRF